MLRVLGDLTYRRLFLAQVVALIGTGLATVALGLLAFDLAGANAGAVLGTALAIKMAAYVGVAPVAAALATRVPRRSALIGLDLVRAAVALCLPFVGEIWQVYALIFVLQSASAGFTPLFQATIPDVLPDEADYTRALSLSRLAYDLESLASPALAAALLLVIGFSDLFVGTAAGFLASAALVRSVALPSPKPAAPRGVWDGVTRGARLYLATPRLRGLLAVCMATAAGGAMVIVNSVVLTREVFGLGPSALALALAAFGAGSMTAALALPGVLARRGDRPVMLGGAAALTAGLIAGPLVTGMAGLLPLWFAIGLGYSAALTPSGRLLRASSHPEDRPALFAAQFALSHACWLVAYPLAGRLGAAAGLGTTFLALAALAAASGVAACLLWPAGDDAALPHAHPDLPPDHPHLRAGGVGHAHLVIIDDLHPSWPRAA
jgi:MFS family permease